MRKETIHAAKPSNPFKALAAPIGLALVLVFSPAGADEDEPDATIEIEQAQFALLATVNAGGGKLHYKGETYEFQIGGLGMGGAGISDIKATGNVYHLDNVDDFYGTYLQMSTGAAVADKGAGSLWLKNTDGVVLEIDTENQGLMLTMGTEGVLIDPK